MVMTDTLAPPAGNARNDEAERQRGPGYAIAMAFETARRMQKARPEMIVEDAMRLAGITLAARLARIERMREWIPKSVDK
jgi:hypothetical protein